MTTAYLVDTSAWVAWFRDAEGADALDVLAGEPERLVTTELVLMEIRAGARDSELARIEYLLGALPDAPLLPRLDCGVAADLYRTARRSGLTIRSQIDCMIAAVALRTGLTVLHRDADYEHLAAVSGRLDQRRL